MISVVAAQNTLVPDQNTQKLRVTEKVFLLSLKSCLSVYTALFFALHYVTTELVYIKHFL